VLTTIALAVACYVIGRAHSVGRYHEHAFQAWRDHVLGCALLPRTPHLLELTADEVQP
jgi:hypothetical protein